MFSSNLSLNQKNSVFNLNSQLALCFLIVKTTQSFTFFFFSKFYFKASPIIDTSLVKAMVFPVVMYGCESCTIKKAEH